MRELLSRAWWVFLLRGVMAIVFGLGALLVPAITLSLAILIYGAYALADGVVATIGAFGGRSKGGFSWAVLLIGLLGIGAGLVTFVYPGLTALVLLYLIAGWSILRGIVEIAVAIELRKEIQGEGWLILAGLTSVLFGMFLVLRPGAGALAVLWIIGVFAIVFGIVNILLAMRLKGLTPARA